MYRACRRSCCNVLIGYFMYMWVMYLLCVSLSLSLSVCVCVCVYVFTGQRYIFTADKIWCVDIECFVLERSVRYFDTRAGLEGFLQSVVITKIQKDKVYRRNFPRAKTWPLQCWRKLRSGDWSSSQESHYSISKTKNASSNANVRESKIPGRFALIFCRSELTALSRIRHP